MQTLAAGTEDIALTPLTAGAAPRVKKAVPAWGDLALRTLTATPFQPKRAGGFTLLELLIVLVIMAIATAGVSLSLRSSSATALEREAQRLAVLLESGRAQSRMSANPVRWRPTATGFSFEGLTNPATLPSNWLSNDIQAASAGAVLLGPEPVIGPQQIRLVSISDPARSLSVATDGVRPFAVLADGATLPDAP